MSVRMGMFPPPNVGAVPGQMQPAPNPFAPLPPMPLAGMPPPPPMMGGMPPPPMGGMQPPPMGPTGPMGAGLGAPPSGQMPQQASNAPRRRQFGDYLENQLSGPSAPVQRSAPQNSFNGPMSSMDIFGGQPMQRPMQQQRPMPRPMMGGNMVQGYDEGGEAVAPTAPAAPTGVDKVLVEKYGYEFEDGKAYAPGKTPSALAVANPSARDSLERPADIPQSVVEERSRKAALAATSSSSAALNAYDDDEVMEDGVERKRTQKDIMNENGGKYFKATL